MRRKGIVLGHCLDPKGKCKQEEKEHKMPTMYSLAAVLRLRSKKFLAHNLQVAASCCTSIWSFTLPLDEIFIVSHKNAYLNFGWRSKHAFQPAGKSITRKGHDSWLVPPAKVFTLFFWKLIALKKKSGRLTGVYTSFMHIFTLPWVRIMHARPEWRPDQHSTADLHDSSDCYINYSWKIIVAIAWNYRLVVTR